MNPPDDEVIFEHVGEPGGAPELPFHAPGGNGTSGNGVALKVPTPRGVPGKGAIPAGPPPPPPPAAAGAPAGQPPATAPNPAVGENGQPVSVALPVITQPQGTDHPRPTAAPIPAPVTPPTLPPPASAASTPSAVPPQAETSLGEVAEGRITALITRAIASAEEQLIARGEKTTKSMLEAFLANSGKAFIERLTLSMIDNVLAIVKPIRAKQILGGVAIACVIVGIALGIIADRALSRPSQNAAVTALLMADPHMAEALAHIGTRNDPAMIMRIATCDGGLGLKRQLGRDGRVRCAGSSNARYGWELGDF